jgi:hypothetical protein
VSLEDHTEAETQKNYAKTMPYPWDKKHGGACDSMPMVYETGSKDECVVQKPASLCRCLYTVIFWQVAGEAW